MSLTRRIKYTPEQMTNFWRELNEQADVVYHAERTICMGNMTIRLVYHHPRLEEYGMSQLKLAETVPVDKPDLILHCMISDLLWKVCDAPEKYQKARIECQGKCTVFNLDYNTDCFYGNDGVRCYVGWKTLQEDIPRQLGHFLYRQFAAIFRQRDLHMLHGGCVGVDGTGVLLCGIGGSGKSTLAAACLLNGMDYVAEDYLLLNRTEDGFRAWPTYSTMNLSEFMLGAMPEYAAHDLGYLGWKGKHFVDLSHWEAQFCPGMRVTAAVLPRITQREEPVLYEIPPSQPMAQLISSTVRQTSHLMDDVRIRELSQLLLGLPTWQMELCPDVHKNAIALRAWIADQNKYNEV